MQKGTHSWKEKCYKYLLYENVDKYRLYAHPLRDEHRAKRKGTRRAALEHSLLLAPLMYKNLTCHVRCLADLLPSLVAYIFPGIRRQLEVIQRWMFLHRLHEFYIVLLLANNVARHRDREPVHNPQATSTAGPALLISNGSVTHIEPVHGCVVWRAPSARPSDAHKQTVHRVHVILVCDDCTDEWDVYSPCRMGFLLSSYFVKCFTFSLLHFPYSTTNQCNGFRTLSLT